MGIRFQCQHCQRPLNLKSDLAGRKGICPHCNGRFRIPLKSTSNSPSDDSQLVESDSVASDAFQSEVPPSCLFWVCPPSGGRYGPANMSLLMEWAQQARITKDSMLYEVTTQANGEAVDSGRPDLPVNRGVRAELLLVDFFNHTYRGVKRSSSSSQHPSGDTTASKSLLAEVPARRRAVTGGKHPNVAAQNKRMHERNMRLIIACALVAIALLLAVALYTVTNRV